jgi:hypothetical protein
MANLNADQDAFDLLTGVTLTQTQQESLRTKIGSLGNLVEQSNHIAASPNVIIALENNKLFTNDGATAENVHTLPPCELGLRYTFFVKETVGIKIQAGSGTGEHLRLGDAGPVDYVQSSVVGAVIEFVCVTSTAWIALADDPVDWTANGSPTGVGAHGEYYFSAANQAITTLAAATAAKFAGTTTARNLHGFTHTNNRLTYNGIGNGSHDFLVACTLTVKLEAGSGATKAKIMIFKNGVAETGLEIRQSLLNTGDEVAMSLVGGVTLTTNDYIEIFALTGNGDDLTCLMGVVKISDEGPNQ